MIRTRKNTGNEECNKAAWHGLKATTKKPSMKTLVSWNVSKALEHNPRLDLREAIKSAQERLEQSALVLEETTRLPEERYLACALLAWQRLGHNHAESLYSFVAINRNENDRNAQKAKEEHDRSSSSESVNKCREPNLVKKKEHTSKADVWRMGVSTSIGASSLGPVVKIPSVPKTVLRMEDSSGYCFRHKPVVLDVTKVTIAPTPERKKVNEKIDGICCLDSACSETLEKMDKTTTELRKRAEQLAKREGERATLLERAETAWRDLESGYQRRLVLAAEKEEEILKQNERIVQERNTQKAGCNQIMSQLESATAVAEKEKLELEQLEREVCAAAVERAKLVERAAASDSRLAEVLCKIAQLDRDVAFREDQLNRKQQGMESQMEGSMALTLEADRAMRAELLGLLDQMQQVARDLMAEDQDSCRFTCDLEELREERDALTNDLEKCQIKCDEPWLQKMDDIKKKREELVRLREEEMECRCQRPVDKSVTVKRTPSLAALCECTASSAVTPACSCTSMRGRLLSDLLSDLFRGLQSQLCEDTVMPCQMLKCLEDKHKWDGASDVKTNLRNYFSKLLLGELDIAIATSIENYHIKWVGESCADKKRVKSPCGVSHSESWQEHALEVKAKVMAQKIAEQMFQEKAEQLADQAKDILAKSGRPPCECHPPSCTPNERAVYQCFVKPPERQRPRSPPHRSPAPPCLRQALRDVTCLRTQIEKLKKETINREDLDMMEKKIVKMVNHGTVKPRVPQWKALNTPDKIEKKPITNRGTVDTNVIQRPIKKRRYINNNTITKSKNAASTKPKGPISVNMCLIKPQKDSYTPSKLPKEISDACKSKSNQGGPLKTDSQLSGSKHEKYSPKSSFFNSSKLMCREEGCCFHKKPSNTSIDKLLVTLSKWKEDLREYQDKRILMSDQQNSTNFKCSSSSKSIQIQNQSNLVVRKGISKLVVSKLNSQKIDPIINEKKKETKSSAQINDHISALMPALPISIESEYMAAINLENSYTSCDKDKNVEVRGVITSNKYPIHIPFKCIDSTKCPCKGCQLDSTKCPCKGCLLDSTKCPCKGCLLDSTKRPCKGGLLDSTKCLCKGCLLDSTKCPCKDCLSVPVPHEQGFNAQSFIFNVKPSCRHCKQDSNDLLTNKIKNHEVGDGAKSRDNNVESSGKTETEYKNPITCLGVTLTNVTSKKLFQTKTNSKKYDKKTVRKKDLFEVVKKIPHTKHFEENKSAGSIVTNKSVELCNSKVCVCCQNIDTENSKDLEVNTFQLLGEHVKGKLEEFKNTFCDSSCIPNAEEEKLFTTILRRIKLLIDESTRPSMNCKCASNNTHVNGSWNRAYNLLQEYLKTKMKRVRCQCSSDGKIEDKNDLPKVLNNISLLIENDLQRIQTICKCKNSVSLDESKNISSNNKVTDYFHNINLRKVKQIDFDSNPLNENSSNVLENLKKSIFLTSNMSAQVSHYQSMEAKSCTAMTINQKYTEVQTVDETKLQNNNNNNVAPEQTIRETELINTSRNKSGNHVKIEKSPSDEETQKVHKMNQECCNAPLPYIGHTLNCCCNHDLGCFCTKSTVRAIDDRLNINYIWKTLTNEEAVSDNISNKLSHMKIRGDRNTKNVPKGNSIQRTKSNVRETVLNKSTESTDKAIEAKKIVKRIKHFKSDHRVDNSLETSDHASKPVRNRNNAIVKLNKLDDIYSPRDNFRLSDNSDIDKSDSCSTNCDCKMVPICHVKMLVANIEDKLANAQCTCDSLSPKVCPVHS